MPSELPPGCLRLLNEQAGVIAVGQAVNVGLTAKAVRAQVHAGRWQLMHRGIYAAFTGQPPRQAELWAVVLRAGGPHAAVLTHQTAAELWGLLDRPVEPVHVTVPYTARLSTRGPRAGHPCGPYCPVRLPCEFRAQK